MKGMGFMTSKQPDEAGLDRAAAYTRSNMDQESRTPIDREKLYEELKREHAANYCHAHQGPVRLEDGKCPLCVRNEK